MGRWFRFYDDAINDPKILKLPEASRWHWTALLCIASKHDGVLPPTEDVALMLRVKTAAAAAIIATMKAAGLLDLVDGRFSPHNWSGRQYKSDVSNDRVKRHRERKRNVTSTVTVTPPETDTETEQISEANASGAVAPVDHRKRLFDEGLSKLARMTGKGPDACRSFVGKCLSAAGDDAVVVLGLIEDAERNKVVDPSAWIAARLKGPQNGNAGSKIIQAADDLRRKIASFDGPASEADGIRGSQGEASPRLLSHG
jgi:hypothetical protein